MILYMRLMVQFFLQTKGTEERKGQLLFFRMCVKRVNRPEAKHKSTHARSRFF